MTKDLKFRIRYDEWEVIINGARDAKQALVIAQVDYNQHHNDKFYYPGAINDAFPFNSPFMFRRFDLRTEKGVAIHKCLWLRKPDLIIR